jgi:lipid-A-disaccharide synthase
MLETSNDLQKSKSDSAVPSLMVIVGDHSADHHVARVIRRLRETTPNLKIWGVGGTEMKEQGVELLYHLDEINTIGIIEVIKFLPALFKVFRTIVKQVVERQPSLILMADYGAFNLRVARYIRKKVPNQKIVYFISPQVWGSRPWRIQTVKDNISKMLVIFPFEETLYKQHGVQARFVGHPISEQNFDVGTLKSKTEFADSLGLRADATTIAVFPGSRPAEIKNLLPVALDAASLMLQTRPELQFVISQTTPALKPLIEKITAKSAAKERIGKNIFFSESSDNKDLMKHADLVWAKSGTITLEVMMFGKPMLIFYRGNWLTYMFYMMFKTVKNVGWPNLLAGRTLVPELLQLDCRPQELVRYSSDFLDVPGLKDEVTQGLLSLKNQLGQGNYVENCTQEILEFLNNEGTVRNR